MPAPTTPHLDVPVRFNQGRPVVVEQGTPEQVAACVQAVLRYQQGDLEHNPRFGRPDLAFTAGGPTLDDIRAILERWEPRALDLLTNTADETATPVDEAVAEIIVDLTN